MNRILPWIWIIFVVLGIVLCAYTFFVGSSQFHRDIRSDNINLTNSNCQFDMSRGNCSSEDKNSVSPFWQWFNVRGNAITALSTILLAVFTFALVIATVFLFISGEKSAEAAQKAANAAVTSNTNAKAALELSQRPWVVADAFEPKALMKTNDRAYAIEGILRLKNTGPTLARQVFVTTRLLPQRQSEKWRIVDEYFKANRDVNLGSGWPIGIVLAPNQGVDQQIGLGGPGSDEPTLEEVIKGKFWIVGLIGYIDRFGKSHRTRFAYAPSNSISPNQPWDQKSYVVPPMFQDAD